ncbi:MAG: exodeoxyribonuclease VII small subunit [Clostridia bacterium]|nr:exodeoxyribonuclease VII small subunit [Clostridia bacterium]
MEQYTLDTAMRRVAEITQLLEQNTYDLEMSMKLYEEGVHLISFCNTALNNARQRITELSALPEEDETDVQ